MASSITYSDIGNGYETKISEITISKYIDTGDIGKPVKQEIREKLKLEPEEYDIIQILATYEFDRMEPETGERFPVDFARAKIAALKRHKKDGEEWEQKGLDTLGETEIELDRDIAQDIYEEWIHRLFPYMPAD